ncbi:hypothetical protein FOZ61_008371 [Perkinsus olseni]|nr:hypothetical protein FOZ61_008371 [Perkinsus olseni]
MNDSDEETPADEDANAALSQPKTMEEGPSEPPKHEASAFNRRLTTDLIIRDLNQAVAADLRSRLPHLNQHQPSEEADREGYPFHEPDRGLKAERHMELTTPYHFNRAASILAPSPHILVRAPTPRVLEEDGLGMSGRVNPGHHEFYRTPTFAASLPRRDTRDDVIYQFAPHFATPSSMLLYDSTRQSYSSTLRPTFASSRTANELGLLSLGQYDNETVLSRRPLGPGKAAPSDTQRVDVIYVATPRDDPDSMPGVQHITAGEGTSPAEQQGGSEHHGRDSPTGAPPAGSVVSAEPAHDIQANGQEDSTDRLFRGLLDYVDDH